MNKGSSFLEGSFSNKDSRPNPIYKRQFQLERFFSKSKPINFNINGNKVMRPVKWKKLSFSGIEINKLLPAAVYSIS